MSDISRYSVSPHDSILSVMERVDQNGAGIALVIDDAGRLLDVVTDGDLRRSVLSHINLNAPISQVLEHREPTQYPHPLVMPAGTPNLKLLNTMRKHGIRQIPLVDAEGRAVHLALLSDLIDEAPNGVVAVLMAGGFGRRLHPLTESTPKPMLTVAKEPILRRTIESLREAGITDVKIAVHYKRELITEYFGDGSELNVNIDYIHEDSPQGTAGSLSRLSGGDRPILLMNGDILTNIDFHAMIDFHRQHKATMTVAIAPHEVAIPFGVVQIDDIRIRGVVEKPVRREFVSIGVYVLEPDVCELIPRDVPYDMPELIQRLLGDKRLVIGFPVREYWRDLGRPEDLLQAESDVLLWKRKNG